jgi:tetratricopeptide (TPR) repeat protein
MHLQAPPPPRLSAVPARPTAPPCTWVYFCPPRVRDVQQHRGPGTDAKRHTRRAASYVLALGLLLAASSASLAATGSDTDGSGGPADLGKELAAQSDEGMELRRTFEMIAQGQIEEAEPRLTRSIGEYEGRGALPEEMAVLLKYRADVRFNLGRLQQAREDYTAALSALDAVDASASDTICLGSADVRVAKYSGREETGTAAYCVYIPAAEDLLLRRARLSMLLGGDFIALASQDLSRVIALAEGEGALQPYAHLYRGDSLMVAGQYQGAAADFSSAARDFASIGDRVNAEVARAGWAFALYGTGNEEEAVSKMQDVVLRTPSINGDIELLLSLAEKEATVHVALAAHYWGQGQQGAAEGEWDRACVRFDAMADYLADLSLRGKNASPFDKEGTEKVQKTYYKPPSVNNRGCKQFRDRSWVSQQRAWPPSNVCTHPHTCANFWQSVMAQCHCASMLFWAAPLLQHSPAPPPALSLARPVAWGQPRAPRRLSA